jgi:hypothetical protein
MKPIVLPVQFVFIQQIAGSEGVIQPIEEADFPRTQASAARSKNEKNRQSFVKAPQAYHRY